MDRLGESEKMIGFPGGKRGVEKREILYCTVQVQYLVSCDYFRSWMKGAGRETLLLPLLLLLGGELSDLLWTYFL
jgi:hypothetical protein